MTAALHSERIARSDAPAPTRWLLFTHGIYGAGMNWRAIARKINERRPEWGVLLVDLRGHGRSPAGEPPHTIAACAADVAALVHSLDLPVDAIAGHSFGGKVMMATRTLLEPSQTWILDASPSPRPGAIDDADNTVTAVLLLMEQLPAAYPRREDFVAAITAHGHREGLANWLAMNLVAGDDGLYRTRLDLPAIRAMLADYWARDLWSEIAAGPGAVEFVVATKAASISADDRARLRTLPSHVTVHDLDADHWLNLDAPAAVIELFATRLP